MSRAGYFQCLVCYRQTPLLTVKEAAQLVGVSDRAVYVWVKRKKIHVMKTVSGQLRICQRSLLSTGEPEAEASRVTPGDQRIKLALRILDEEYQHYDRTLNELSKQLGISMWYFARLFKKNTGIGFREYLRGLRMKKAAELLGGTLLSVKEISISVGYKHVSDFDHHFKAVYGIQPSAYRRVRLTLGKVRQANPQEE